MRSPTGDKAGHRRHTDVTTDAKIPRYDLVVLGDRRFFPPYDAVLLHRADALAQFPKLARVFARGRGLHRRGDQCGSSTRAAELDGIGFADVARRHLGGRAVRGAQRRS